MRFPRVALTAGLLASFLALPLAAAADTYDYTYSETAYYTAAFTFDSPVLIASDTIFTPLTCSVSSPGFIACSSVEIDPTSGDMTIYYTNSGGSTSLASTFSPTFFDVGDNTAGGGLYVMDITDVPATAVTPEPSSLLLFVTGLLGLTAFLRRRPIRPMMER